MSENSLFKNYITSCYQSLGDELPDDVKLQLSLRFLQSNEFKDAIIKEGTFKLEDRIFGQFYRLASLQDFSLINKKYDHKFDTIWKDLCQGDLSMKIDQDPLTKEISRHSLVLDSLLKDYITVWKAYFNFRDNGEAQGDNQVDTSNPEHNVLVEEIESRVLSMNVSEMSSGSTGVGLKESLQVAAIFFDMAVEMAICAQLACDLGKESLAWTALTKSAELLGLTRSLVVEIESDKKRLGQTLGKSLIGKTKNDCIKCSVIQSIQRKTVSKAWPKMREFKQVISQYVKAPEKKEIIRDYLFKELSSDAAQLYFGLFNRFLPDDLKETKYIGGIAQPTTQDEAMKLKFYNWTRADTNFRRVVKEYVDMMMVEISQKKDSTNDENETLVLNKSHIEMLKNTQHYWGKRADFYGSCSAELCPKRAELEQLLAKFDDILITPGLAQVAEPSKTT